MKAFLIGADETTGRSALSVLVDAGHDVVALCDSSAEAMTVAERGAAPCRAGLRDVEALADAMTGCDAVINLATRRPVGLAMVRPGAWRSHDRLARAATPRIAAAAARAGVPRLVQGSTSTLYADGGDEWIDEYSPIGITRATDAVADAEQHALEFEGDTVLLRLGLVVGDEPMTRWLVRRARQGRPTGWGKPSAWRHVLHVDDVGTAVEAALAAPPAVYDVGAEPCRNADLALLLAQAGDRHGGRFHGPFTHRLAGARLEPFTRSHRVSSQRLADRTGWHPAYPKLTPEWFDDVV